MGNTLVNCFFPCGSRRVRAKIGPSIRLYEFPESPVEDHIIDTKDKHIEDPIDEIVKDCVKEDPIKYLPTDLDTIIEESIGVPVNTSLCISPDSQSDTYSSSSSSSNVSRVYVLSSLGSNSELYSLEGPEHDSDCASDFSMCPYPPYLYVGRTSPRRTPSNDTDGDWGETPPRTFRKLNRFSEIAPLSKSITTHSGCYSI